MHVSIHLSMQLDRRETVIHTQCPVGGGGQRVGDSCFHVAYKLCMYNICAAMFYIQLFSNVCILCMCS